MDIQNLKKNREKTREKKHENLPKKQTWIFVLLFQAFIIFYKKILFKKCFKCVDIVTQVVNFTKKKKKIA